MKCAFHHYLEFEASHGTVSDLWHAHLRGEQTSLNPLGLIEALLGAMNHSADLLELNQSNVPVEVDKMVGSDVKTKVMYKKDAMYEFTSTLRRALHNTFRYGQGTRDMAGENGLSTEDFVGKVNGTIT